MDAVKRLFVTAQQHLEQQQRSKRQVSSHQHVQHPSAVSENTNTARFTAGCLTDQLPHNEVCMW